MSATPKHPAFVLTCGALTVAVMLTMSCAKGSPSPSSAPTAAPVPAPQAGTARLPWEARLTKGARFQLRDTISDDGDPISVTVTSVEESGDSRVYHLKWSDMGPSTVTVRGSSVLIDDADVKRMKEPFVESDGTVCYGEDFSDPEGECENVCDADLCFHPKHGIVKVAGLYAPNDGFFEK